MAKKTWDDAKAAGGGVVGSVVGGFRVAPVIGHGDCIIEPHQSGSGDSVVARVIDPAAVNRLLAQANAANQGVANAHLLTPLEYDVITRDAENWKRLEDDVAAGRKVVASVPPDVETV